MNYKKNLYIKEGPAKKIALAKIFMDDVLFTRKKSISKAHLRAFLFLKYTLLHSVDREL